MRQKSAAFWVMCFSEEREGIEVWRGNHQKGTWKSLLMKKSSWSERMKMENEWPSVQLTWVHADGHGRRWAMQVWDGCLDHGSWALLQVLQDGSRPHRGWGHTNFWRSLHGLQQAWWLWKKHVLWNWSTEVARSLLLTLSDLGVYLLARTEKLGHLSVSFPAAVVQPTGLLSW